MALAALKVAALAGALALLGYMCMWLGFNAMDDGEKILISIGGGSAMGRHPVLVAFGLLISLSALAALVALVWAALAWVVGA